MRSARGRQVICAIAVLLILVGYALAVSHFLREGDFSFLHRILGIGER